MVPSDKYAKIVYESDPIGKEKIVLVLTTFDIEKYNEDQRLLEMPKKYECKQHEIPNYVLSDKRELQLYLNDLESRINAFINNKYEYEIERMKKEIEYYRRQSQLAELECQRKIIVTDALERRKYVI